MVVGTVAAALYWLVRRPGNRLGSRSSALAVATAVISLQGATQPVLHIIGVAVEPIFFLLAYYVGLRVPRRPAGRSPGEGVARGDGALLPDGVRPLSLLLAGRPGGAPLAGCTAECPTNAFMIADRPTIAASYGSDGSYAVIAIMSATLACLLYRLATATRPRRRALLPVYVPAVVLTVPILIFHGVVTQLLHLDASTIWDLGWFVTIARCALPFGFLLAIVQTTFFAATALKAIVGRLVDNPNAVAAAHGPGRGARRAVTRARVPRRREPAASSTRAAGLSHRRGRPAVRRRRSSRNGDTVAVIVHDAALDTDPELVATAGQALLLALENGRLLTELDVDDRGAPRFACAHRGRGRRRAPQDRARPPRRSAAAPGRASDQGRSGGRVGGGGSTGRIATRRPRHRARGDPAGAPRSRARGCTRLCSASSGFGRPWPASSRRSAPPAKLEAAGDRPLRRGDRVGRLLLLPGRSSERRQARRHRCDTR